MVAHKAACHVATLSNAFMKSLKTWDRSADVGGTFHTFSKIDDLSCGDPFDSEPGLFFSKYVSGMGFKPVQDDFQHNFA